MTAAVLLAAALAAAAAPAPSPAPTPASAPEVSSIPRAQALPGTELEFKSVDGWDLHAVWKAAEEGKSTLVLLAGTGQRKEEWKPFARALAKAGYGYAALDMRGHGESRTMPSGEVITYKKLRATKGANDYEDMTRDVEALVASLTGQGVIEESIGVLGAEVGGSIAVKYAAVHSKVPFVIMLSPGLAWQEIPLVNAVRAFKGRATPILMVHSEADKRSAKETPLLYAFAKNSVGENNTTLIVVPDERGTRMLRKNKDLTGLILTWLADPHPSAVAVSSGAVSGVSSDTSTTTAEPEPDTETEPEGVPAQRVPAPEHDTMSDKDAL
jgi:alpha-beta hydrolase superfamily lysophospholipase